MTSASERARESEVRSLSDKAKRVFDATLAAA